MFDVVVTAEIVTAVKTVAVVGVMVLVVTVIAVVYCIYQGKTTNWVKRPTTLKQQKHFQSEWLKAKSFHELPVSYTGFNRDIFPVLFALHCIISNYPLLFTALTSACFAFAGSPV